MTHYSCEKFSPKTYGTH